MPFHRWNISVVIAFPCKQRISKSFTVKVNLHGISGLQPTDFNHFFTGAPVNSSCRLRIIKHPRSVDHSLRTVGMINSNTPYFGPCRKRIVIEFDHRQSFCAFSIKNFIKPVNIIMTEPGFHHFDPCTVENNNYIRSWKSFFVTGFFNKIVVRASKGSCNRQIKKEE